MADCADERRDGSWRKEWQGLPLAFGWYSQRQTKEVNGEPRNNHWQHCHKPDQKKTRKLRSQALPPASSCCERQPDSVPAEDARPVAAVLRWQQQCEYLRRRDLEMFPHQRRDLSQAV